MTVSEQQAMLSPEEVAKLQMNKAPIGCLIILIIALVIGGAAVGIFFNSSLVLVAAYVIISAAIFIGYFLFRKKTNSLIDQDISAARKNVIIAPIESKRIDASEITSGRRQGQIRSKYYMIVKGTEYEMNESAYLNIRQGEFIETHIAPKSQTILQQKWLQADGTVQIITVE